ncbi:MAG: peptide-methionine (R)-S-oxide reductase [Gammaproteobacteria bacterium PRO8]|nr:peptide-methionine (R)-S-oxide reductase [Gammaproteobacteria bacterium PRO8]
MAARHYPAPSRRKRFSRCWTASPPARPCSDGRTARAAAQAAVRMGDAARLRVLFQDGTEAPWTSPLNDVKQAGTFICAACYLPLFEADAKFDSGTGWPSFFRPIDPARIATQLDFKLGVPRTEYHCARCGGHQGHVFDDGPAPTGQRYCNNGVSLLFVPQGQPLPALRD